MNRSLRVVVTVIAIVFAIGGMNHGVFESLQGNTPTPGFFIEAIGPDHLMWEHGQEGAVTIIPNFLVTGILCIATGVAIVLWALFGLGNRGGAWVLLGLFVLFFLFGGGVAQVPFFLLMWGFGTRITKPLTWWRRALPDGGPKWLQRLWRPAVTAIVFLMVFALWVAVTGIIPGVENPDTTLAITLACVGTSLLLSIASYISAIADDIARA